jgi:hypothetical protein
MSEGESSVITVEYYRKITNDHKSTDEQIQKRINYLGALCSNIVRNELEKYVKSSKD